MNIEPYDEEIVRKIIRYEGWHLKEETMAKRKSRESTIELEKLIADFERTWPDQILRHRFTELSCGLLSSRTLANKMVWGRARPL